MKVSELIKLLNKSNCQLLRHGTNHDIWISSVTGKQFPVPRHPSEEVSKGTLHSILTDAGIK